MIGLWWKWSKFIVTVRYDGGDIVLWGVVVLAVGATVGSIAEEKWGKR